MRQGCVVTTHVSLGLLEMAPKIALTISVHESGKAVFNWGKVYDEEAAATLWRQRRVEAVAL